MKRIGKNLWVLLLVSALIIVSTIFAASSDVSQTPTQDQINPVNPSDVAINQMGTLTLFDAYLKIDGIPGESTDEMHKDWIDIKSYSWGETQAAQAMGGGRVIAGNVNMKGFQFVMKFNKASPKLFLAVASGQHIKNAVLELCRKGEVQVCFLKWTLSDVVATSYQTVGGTEEGDVEDQFSLNFGKIEVEYKRINPDGTPVETIKAFWDLKTNRGG